MSLKVSGKIHLFYKKLTKIVDKDGKEKVAGGGVQRPAGSPMMKY